jgi:hypothetical protein
MAEDINGEKQRVKKIKFLTVKIGQIINKDFIKIRNGLFEPNLKIDFLYLLCQKIHFLSFDYQ